MSDNVPMERHVHDFTSQDICPKVLPFKYSLDVLQTSPYTKELPHLIICQLEGLAGKNAITVALHGKYNYYTKSINYVSCQRSLGKLMAGNTALISF